MKLKKALATAFMLNTLVGVGCDNRQPSVQEARQDTLRSVFLSYLSQPQFTNSDLLEQITGTKAKLQLYDLREDMLYFSLSPEHSMERTLERLTLEPKRVDSAHVEGQSLVLGDYVFSKKDHSFFRFPAEDFRVDKNAQIRIAFEQVQYTVTPEELTAFMHNKSVYGGFLNVRTGTMLGRPIKMANHGAFVAREREPSLERLVSQLTGTFTRKEDIAQTLLDFVTQQIKYDWSDALASVEVLKRPNEVLMARGSDCSGKTILYASLLEQTGIDYLLVYFPGHIAVAVEGGFRDSNGLSFMAGNKRYAVAETTKEKFKIGVSQLPELSIEDIRYLQRPGESSRIHDAASGKPLPFE